MKKVVVIGGGPAGISASHELLKKSDQFEVLLLEESNMLGGISRTVQYNGNRMDIGGHRFFSKDSEVTKWWTDRMPIQGHPSYDDKILHREVEIAEFGPDPEIEDTVMLVRNRVSRIYYKSNFFDYPISMKWQTIKNLGFWKTGAAGFSYFLAKLNKREESSLENFYINRFGKVLYELFFEGYTEKLWGRHPRDISAEWGAQRVKGLSITAILKNMFSKVFSNSKVSKEKQETSLIEEFFYPKYGPGQLWETAALEVENMGGVIQKNSKVVGINKDQNNQITGVVYVQDGVTKEVEADIVISSMPLKDLIESMESVPKSITDIASGLPYRDFVTVGLLTKKLNLKNETNIKTLGNIVPDCWMYIQDTDIKLGRIQIFNNWSPYMVQNPAETVWIGLEYFCQEGDEFWNLTDKEAMEFAINELIKMGIVNNAGDVLDAHRERVKKAYPAYFDTYKDIEELKTYLDTHSNLYCVGRNGQHRYNNMDHSMVTSFEAVKNILSGETNKENIWNVNTEKEYHESKETKDVIDMIVTKETNDNEKKK